MDKSFFPYFPLFPLYFFSRFFFYLKSFIYDYFKGSYGLFLSFYWDFFSLLEKRMGVLVNIRYFRVPLWREYSFAAYLLSIPIRLIKIILGGLALCFFSLFFWLIYLLFILTPFYLILKFITL